MVSTSLPPLTSGWSESNWQDLICMANPNYQRAMELKCRFPASSEGEGTLGVEMDAGSIGYGSTPQNVMTAKVAVGVAIWIKNEISRSHPVAFGISPLAARVLFVFETRP